MTTVSPPAEVPADACSGDTSAHWPDLSPKQVAAIVRRLLANQETDREFVVAAFNSGP